MTITNVEIIVNNKRKEYNKKLTSFLKDNLRTYIRQGLRFSYNIVKDGDTSAVSSLKSQGVTELPCMIALGKKYYKTENIITAIKNLSVYKCKEPIDEEDVIRDTLQKQLYMGTSFDGDNKIIVKEETEGDSGDAMDTNDVQQKMCEYMKKKEACGMKLSADQSKHVAEREPYYKAPAQPEPAGQRPQQPAYVPPKQQSGGKQPGDPLSIIANDRTNNAQDDMMQRAMLERLGGDDYL